MSEQPTTEAGNGVSKVKIALGAASLFLFIVGVKRTFSMDEAQPTGGAGAVPAAGQRPPGAR